MNAPSIMVVDDDPELRQSILDVLEDAGFSTMAASGGEEALRQLDGPQRPQLILLDLMMPGMNGWQFREAQQADERLRGIPVLVITASRYLATHPIDVERVVFKPFSLDQLLGAIRELTAGSVTAASPSRS
jgi:CheY-like chemotaxis protein